MVLDEIGHTLLMFIVNKDYVSHIIAFDFQELGQCASFNYIID